MKIQDVMTTEVATVQPTASLKEVARKLVERGISGMPVVDPDGRVLGVISEADLLVKERGARDRRGGLVARLVNRNDVGEQRKRDAHVAGQAMTTPPITIGAQQSVAAAAALMLDRQVNRLPVVMKGRLAGIVTRADLVRAFARTDAEVAREIGTEVEFFQALWQDDVAVGVQVDDGEVTLDGSVARRSHAELLPQLVGMVPGVVGVRSEVTWSEDDSRPARMHDDDS
jgi:CBS domain-containing protein